MNNQTSNTELVEICRKDILNYRAQTQCTENVGIIHYRLTHLQHVNMSLEELRPYILQAMGILHEAENGNW